MVITSMEVSTLTERGESVCSFPAVNIHLSSSATSLFFPVTEYLALVSRSILTQAFRGMLMADLLPMSKKLKAIKVSFRR